MPTPPSEALPLISPLMWRWFTWYGKRFLRKHFHAVRIDRDGDIPQLSDDEPIVFYSNHPSWWDPMVGIFLAARLWPARKHYWPIEAQMLQKYRILGKLGFFGVELGTIAGTKHFLRTSEALLAESACLWITAQGEFADARSRPLKLKPGIARLCDTGEPGSLVPIAVEYPFWSERTPEVLLRFGRPIPFREHSDIETLEIELSGAMDTLATSAMSRDPAQFRTVLGGTTGTAGIYDLGRRVRSAFCGKTFDPSHIAEAPASVQEHPEGR